MPSPIGRITLLSAAALQTDTSCRLKYGGSRLFTTRPRPSFYQLVSLKEVLLPFHTVRPSAG